MIGITGAWQFPSAGSGRDGFSCLGAAGFSPGAAEHTILKVYNGVPYLAFVDVANGYRATVMFYHKKKMALAFVRGTRFLQNTGKLYQHVH